MLEKSFSRLGKLKRQEDQKKGKNQEQILLSTQKCYCREQGNESLS